jgi:DNA-binding transcriptional ArsR family regulator
MSKDYVPTGREGATTDGGPSVSDERIATGPGLDELFQVLADENRRRVLAYLADTDDGVAAFSELLEHVADDSAGESSDNDRLAVSLHHNHLPKLADANVVEYDPRSQVVRYRGSRVVSDWVRIARSYEASE